MTDRPNRKSWLFVAISAIAIAIAFIGIKSFSTNRLAHDLRAEKSSLSTRLATYSNVRSRDHKLSSDLEENIVLLTALDEAGSAASSERHNIFMSESNVFVELDYATKELDAVSEINTSDVVQSLDDIAKNFSAVLGDDAVKGVRADTATYQSDTDEYISNWGRAIQEIRDGLQLQSEGIWYGSAATNSSTFYQASNNAEAKSSADLMRIRDDLTVLRGQLAKGTSTIQGRLKVIGVQLREAWPQWAIPAS